MTVKELIEVLKALPENSTIYVEADHGQLPEQQSFVCVGLTNEETYYLDSDDCLWVDYKEATDDYRSKSNVVLIKA